LSVKTRQIRLNNLVAERRTQRNRILQGCQTVGMPRRAIWHARRVGNSQAAGIRPYLLCERSRRWRSWIGVAPRRTAGGIEQRRAVSDRAGEGVFDRPAADHVAILRTEWIARACRLQSKETTRGRGRSEERRV